MASKECLESFFRTPLNGPNQLCLATPVFRAIILLSGTKGKPKRATWIGSESGAFHASKNHQLNPEQLCRNSSNVVIRFHTAGGR
jgi:hypothetical protein